MFWKVVTIIFLVQNAIIIFAVLRIYNAVVGNTRYLIMLKTSLDSYNKALKKLQDAYHNSQVNVKSITNSLIKVTEEYKDTVKRLTDLLNKK